MWPQILSMLGGQVMGNQGGAGVSSGIDMRRRYFEQLMGGIPQRPTARTVGGDQGIPMSLLSLLSGKQRSNDYQSGYLGDLGYSGASAANTGMDLSQGAGMANSYY